jgi:GntR family transcriptional regulator/MocR family aminotransferase
MRTLYKKKQVLLLETIKAEMGSHVRVSGQDAGLHIVIHVKSKFPTVSLIEKAKKAGIRVYETSAYLVQNKDMNYSSLLLGFGGLSPDEIRQGIKLLHKTWLPYYS